MEEDEGQQHPSLEDYGKSLGKAFEPKAHLGPGQAWDFKACEVLGGCVDYEKWTSQPGRFDHITRLMAGIFKTPICHICLLCDGRVWFRSTISEQTVGGFHERCYAWCNYAMIPTMPEILITENAPEDGRFVRSPYVLGEPCLKFYAGAPLVGTGGRRYGTLCVIDFVPRSFTAELYHILGNFAELTVQELEKDVEMMELWSIQAVSDLKKNLRLRACLSTASYGVAMMDTRSSAWNFMYGNEQFYVASGIGQEGGLGEGEVDDLTQSSFFDTFEPLLLREEDVVSVPALGTTVTSLFKCKRTGSVLKLSLRPACSDQLTPGKPVGVPSWVPSEWEKDAYLGVDVESVKVCEMDPGLCQDVEKCFYFVIMAPPPSEESSTASLPAAAADRRMTSTSDEGSSTCETVTDTSKSPTNSKQDTSSSGSCSGPSRSSDMVGSKTGSGGSKIKTTTKSNHSEMTCCPHWLAGGSRFTYGDFPMPEELSTLKMGSMLGSGGFGKVYRGKWNRNKVAVKVVESVTQKRIDRSEAEGALGMSLRHPNIVATLFASSQTSEEQTLVKGGETKTELSKVMWILQEYCDRGTLIDAVERGWLREKRDVTAPPNMVAMYQTILEIAQGMDFIHSKNLVHCDLNGRNVLLTRSMKDRRGFTAKVSDFGFTHVCYGQQIMSNLFGTVSHLAPEQVINLEVSPESDVWSFEGDVTGIRAYRGFSYARTISIIGKGHQLPYPLDAPESYKDLMRACLTTDPRGRPSFKMLIELISIALRDAMVEETLQAGPGGPTPICTESVLETVALTSLRAVRGRAAPQWVTKASTAFNVWCIIDPSAPGIAGCGSPLVGFTWESPLKALQGGGLRRQHSILLGDGLG
eukprot:CAMPEP_0117692580 /NCGR_PEP_ID=MMETSP0804-20121206/26406_1 /TAXON_ID=1074897 /ORGANISM="Tetraselmis astigmatica, Strain CCMP880" /LENGTH=863 /DNA_ID=CAMNT_0005506043 /DNA_START=30 /DNA_END=2621 /DNA_ORIENTATION=+